MIDNVDVMNDVRDKMTHNLKTFVVDMLLYEVVLYVALVPSFYYVVVYVMIVENVLCLFSTYFSAMRAAHRVLVNV
jgi:uncharacterized protein involved in cysteine biosynthesis